MTISRRTSRGPV